jgi:hypothetical protein
MSPFNKTELYEEVVKLVPLKADSDDFRARLSKTFKEYKDKIAKLDLKDQPVNWKDITKRVEQLCEAIERALRKEREGTRHSAYSAIKNQLDGLNRNGKTIIQGLAYSQMVLRIPKGDNFYRMRIVNLEERHNLFPKDMFHIPLDKRGIVSTQRYSVPGYPCLYLSKSVYGCWEEMGRPDFGTTMVSRFQSKEAFYVLDLRIPSLDTWQNNMVDCIKFFPLVIATMMQTSNIGDTYKPEYTISQLLTEWVISHNRDRKKDTNEKNIIGILYTSSQKNGDFNYPDYCNDNYAIPVLKPLEKKHIHCPKLAKIFSLSKPTYYDLEVLKNSRPLAYRRTPNTSDTKLNDLISSRFGEMEDYLKYLGLHSVQ